MPAPEEYNVDSREIGGTKVTVTTYRIQELYFCHVANADPGATIARAEGNNRREAEEIAIGKAVARLTKTRK